MPSSKRRRSDPSSCRRRIYTAAALAFSSAFLFGLATKFEWIAPDSWLDFAHKPKPDYDFPDFNKVIHTYTLSEGELGLNDPNRRVLLVGDLHGMNKSFHHLLSAANYDPSIDTVILAGDTMSKSTLSGSLAILDFLTQHKCGSAAGSLYAVRGNHDQTIIQWRAWRDWFEPLQLSIPISASEHDLLSVPGSHGHPGSPVKTGREFLELIEHEWMRDVERDPKGSADPDEWALVARKRAVGTWREEWWRRVPQRGKGHQNKDWPIFDDHYWLAREMTPEQKACLYSLPFVLHVPSEHFFVVHAGLLPYDPKRPLTDKDQPLAHTPTLARGPGKARYAISASSPEPQTALVSPVVTEDLKNETLEKLRTVQERALLTDIPGNQDPWVLINMRGIRRKKGKVTRVNGKGTPWSKVWNEQMELCKGFIVDDDSANSTDARSHPRAGFKEQITEIELPCEPATVVYGHAATRSLDVKRWSMGLDTGCVYGRRLTSLVLQRPDASDLESLQARTHAEDFDFDEDDDDFDGPASIHEEPDLPRQKWKRKTQKVRFGDDDAGIQAHFVSVRCPDMGD